MLHRRHFLARLQPDALADLVPRIIEALPHTMRRAEVVGLSRELLESGRIPGIVCRPTVARGTDDGQLGFALPIRIGAQRVRSAIGVRRDQIASFASPWEVMEQVARKSGGAGGLRMVREIGLGAGVDVGLIGSHALAAMTGLAYVRPGSDVDIVVRSNDPVALLAFHNAMRRNSGETGIVYDIEIEIQDRFGIKMNELFSPSKALVVKTIDGVSLEDRAVVLRRLCAGGQATAQKTDEMSGQWALV